MVRIEGGVSGGSGMMVVVMVVMVQTVVMVVGRRVMISREHHGQGRKEGWASIGKFGIDPDLN